MFGIGLSELLVGLLVAVLMLGIRQLSRMGRHKDASNLKDEG